MQGLQDSLNDSLVNVNSMLDDFDSQRKPNFEGQIEYEDFADEEVDENFESPLFSSNREQLPDKELCSK